MLRNILALWKKEWLFIRRSRQAMLIIFVIPLFYALFLGLIYWPGTLTHLPLVVCDQDKSSMSRELVSDLGANESLGQPILVNDFSQVQKLIKERKCKAGVIIPKDFAEKLMQGESMEVLAVADGSNIAYANTALTGAGEVIKTFSAKTGLKLLLKEKMLPAQGMNILTAISFREQNLYNPTYNYGYFLSLGMMLTIWQIMAAMGIAITFSREVDEGVYVNFMLSTVSRGELVLGKLLPYYFIYMLEGTLIYYLGFDIFHLPMNGNVWLLLALTALFLLTVLAAGLACSLAADTALNATRYAMLYFLPSFVLSGFAWPTEEMPVLFQWISKCIPLHWALQGFRAITMKGLGFADLRMHFLILGGMAAAFLAASVLMIRKHDRPYKEAVKRGKKNSGYCYLRDTPYSKGQ